MAGSLTFCQSQMTSMPLLSLISSSDVNMGSPRYFAVATNSRSNVSSPLMAPASSMISNLRPTTV